MKAFLAVLIAFYLMGCESQKVIGNEVVQYYGVANAETQKDNCYLYELSFWNTVGAIIFSETIIAPVYVIGWGLFEPIKKDPNCKE